LQEHYGITLAPITIRRITEGHAQRMHEKLQRITTYPDKPGFDCIIAELDGSMIPIVETNNEVADKRKGKKLSWKEARLALAHEKGSVTPKISVVFQKSVDQAGEAMFDCARRSGLGQDSYVHAIGDGAPWIANQVYKQFGANGHYLIDFYHTCDYLSSAAASIVENPTTWLEKHKTMLKNGEIDGVMEVLKANLEAPDVKEKDAPVRACHRYLINRYNQLDYQGAIAKGLPIGSGEVESAHRYVIQERLKKAGAWWSPCNAEFMLALREVRVNHGWISYWNELFASVC